MLEKMIGKTTLMLRLLEIRVWRHNQYVIPWFRTLAPYYPAPLFARKQALEMMLPAALHIVSGMSLALENTLIAVSLGIRLSTMFSVDLDTDALIRGCHWRKVPLLTNSEGRFWDDLIRILAGIGPHFWWRRLGP